MIHRIAAGDAKRFQAVVDVVALQLLSLPRQLTVAVKGNRCSAVDLDRLGIVDREYLVPYFVLTVEKVV